MDQLASLYSFDDSDDDKFEAQCPKSYNEGDRTPCFDVKKQVSCSQLHILDKENICKITEYNDDSQQMETIKYCCAQKLDDCCVPDVVPVTLISIGTFSFIVFLLCLICKYGKRETKGAKNSHTHKSYNKVDFLNEPLVEVRDSDTGFE